MSHWFYIRQMKVNFVCFKKRKKLSDIYQIKESREIKKMLLYLYRQKKVLLINISSWRKSRLSVKGAINKLSFLLSSINEKKSA